ncbi:MAG: hypothetical protein V4574_13065 [Pseudomonadota bacterium]
MPEEPTHTEIEEDPGVATAEEGQVMLDGPDGVAVSMTPDAATETANSLIAAAERARGQQPGDGET